MLATASPTSVATALPKLAVTAAMSMLSSDRQPLFETDTVDAWRQHELHTDHNGLLVKRPFSGMWDAIQPAIDGACEWIGFGLTEEVHLGSENLSADIQAAVNKLLTKAALPTPISEQIRSDALSVGHTVSSLCASSRLIEIKLEIFGESICSRWHRDNYVGRAIVSYTGARGTEYTGDSNVNFWEMEHCGNNECIILDKGRIESVEVGDILFMKGSAYKGAKPLVHKSPQPSYHVDGRVLNRLILKVDVAND